MVNLDDKHLMMIEPQFAPTPAIADDLTRAAEAILAAAVGVADPWKWYRGWHTCSCGARNTHPYRDHIAPGGLITNDLLVHYVSRHRAEVPVGELEKLHAAYAAVKAEADGDQ